MRLAQFYHRHRLDRLAAHPDFRWFELAIWLHTLARSLVSIFVPILLLQTGYSLGETMAYYLLYNAIDVPLNFLAGRLVRRHGARAVLILSTVATIAFFAVLGILPPGDWPMLALLALLAALYDTLFWVSHIYLFIETGREGLDTARAAGALEGVRKIAGVLGPVAGALVLSAGGKLPLVATSIFVFALSIVPLFRLRHVNDVPQEEPTTFRKFFSDPRERRDYLTMALYGIHADVDSVLWPLFIFGVFGSLGAVAAVPVIVAVTTILFSYAAGRLTRRYRTAMLTVGGFLIALVWLLRLTDQAPSFHYVTIFLVGLFSLLISIPLDGSIAARGLAVGPLAAATYRNAASMVLHVALFAVLALLVGVFKVSFVFAAGSLFLLIAINTVFFRAKAGEKAVQPA